ncbi:MAG: (Fe-S)-binding protein [Dehalococcoidia bacterium]|nr:(Fe-S)-binding protein [Dehalococcoidia bacterium]
MFLTAAPLGVPTRVIFWNISYGEIIYILAAVIIAIFIYVLRRRIKIWKLGVADPRQKEARQRIWPFIKIGLLEGLGHKRILREPVSGIAHFLMFWGCIFFLLAAFLDAISHYFFHFLQGWFYLIFSVVLDVFGLLVILAVLFAAYRRYIQKPDRLDNAPEDGIALLFIFFVVASGFVVEGFRMAATEVIPHPSWAVWSPGGLMVASIFGGLTENTLELAHRWWWWIHTLLAFFAMAYIPLSFNKLSHIIVSPVNAYFRSLAPKGALNTIELESAETFGVAKIQDFTWKQLLDLDACTRCGRCQDNCPAYLTGKPLSPKKLIQDLKTHMLAQAPALLSAKNEKAELAEPGKDMIHDVVTDDVIWDCTTCRACQESCPVFVEHIDKIIDMRRNLVLEQSLMPETAQGALKSLEARGHPWRGTTATRLDWASNIDVKVLADNREVDILYWVGCTAALEERSMKISASLARLMLKAGLNFGILGAEESCCGDPARRMGNEYLFQLQALKNIEAMNGYGIKKVVTSCPHCFYTLKYEYPQFGGQFEVIHHSQLLKELLDAGKIKMAGNFTSKVVYHDACYLGRYNDIFSEPRDILKKVPGVTTREMDRRYYKSFCCGAGGGRLWMEEHTGKRINETRTEEALKTGADVIATACPYCIQMFVDGVKTKGVEETVKPMDLAEIIEAAQ